MGLQKEGRKVLFQSNGRAEVHLLGGGGKKEEEERLSVKGDISVINGREIHLIREKKRVWTSPSLAEREAESEEKKGKETSSRGVIQKKKAYLPRR